MDSRQMKPLRWPTNKRQADYMLGRQKQNQLRASRNPNELWLFDHLKTTGHRWSSQARWGYRIFDFWCHDLGIAVESDGPEHRPDYDAYRDDYNLRRSGILVVRVRNKNEGDLAEALKVISTACTWEQRKITLGIKANTKAGRRHLITGQQDLFRHT